MPEITQQDFDAFIVYMETEAGENWINDTSSITHVRAWAQQCGHVGEEPELIYRAIQHYGGV